LVEYFELKIIDNQSDDFLRMLLKSDLPFSSENLRKLYLADLQKTYENLMTNLEKAYENLTKFSTLGPLCCRLISQTLVIWDYVICIYNISYM